MRIRAWWRWPLIAVLATGCAHYQPFDDVAHLRQRYAEALPPELRSRVQVPFELDEATLAGIEGVIGRPRGERERTERIIGYIFSRLDLRYSLVPTRDAAETYAAREGNCLSFVNLFVSIARHQRLNPFFVEVEDYQRWNYRDGVVLSRGHIVAGLMLDGELSTFDFLPYRPKAYREFKPIDDLAAMAHYYNNLGAEALIEDRLDRAEELLRIAVAVAPDFEKALNNLGVIYLRQGRPEEAVELYERALELHPSSVPLLNNLARANQQLGRATEATELLTRLEQINRTNPYFYIYRGELALGQGDTERALEYMREALRTDSEVPEVHLGLVKVFVAMGELERARHHVERALKLDATHVEARKFAAMLALPTPGTR